MKAVNLPPEPRWPDVQITMTGAEARGLRLVLRALSTFVDEEHMDEVRELTRALGEIDG